MVVLERVLPVEGGQTNLRVLVAFEDEYRAYRGAISTAVQDLRPRVCVEASGTDTLPRELARFEPQAVICTLPEGPETDDRIAWIELPLEPDRTARARLAHRRFDLANPALQTILEIIDDAQSLLNPDPRV